MNQSIGPQEQEHISHAQLLAAVADPLRLRILASVRRPCSVQEICGALGDLAQPRVSHHLAVLREHGLVTAQRQGRRRLYRWAEPSDEPRRDLLQLLSRWLGRPSPVAVERGPSLTTVRPTAARARSSELEDFLL